MSTKLKKEYLLLLFEHPTEPVYMLKSGKYYFDIPLECVPDRYKLTKQSEIETYNESVQKFVIPPIYPLPDLSNIKKVDPNENFSTFITQHEKAASELIEIFIKAEPIEKFIALAICIRDHVNPDLFQYALSVAILHRKDTQDLTPPALVFSFPYKFVSGRVYNRARADVSLLLESQRVPLDTIEITKDWTGTDEEEEHRVAYFREDIGINLHHYHWHSVYPLAPLDVIKKRSRKGEIFFYMHQQMLARYNFERFSNKMKRVERISEWEVSMKEAYYSKLDKSNSSQQYPGRSDDKKLGNLFRKDGLRVNVTDMKTWYHRILAAIHDGKVMKSDGEIVPLPEDTGIDILGNIIESSVLSYNRRFYGDIHNKGHMMISAMHDPDNRYQEPYGVMSDNATAVRDPAFFRWHWFIDDIFQEYKATLPPYTPNKLNYPGIFVSDVKLQSQTNETENCKPNIFYTYWRKEEIDISGGLDFPRHRGSYRVRFAHLDHHLYTFTINVKNSTDQEKLGTVRIFLAPRFDEVGRGTQSKEGKWPFVDQRRFFIELDKFVVKLTTGENVIKRKSSESTVSIPFERIFVKNDLEQPYKCDEWCGCGWPEYILIPRGELDKEMSCELFVMISNYDDDKVDDSEDDWDKGASYCGIKGKPYPDRRAMGYPFDREPLDNATDIEDFINSVKPENLNNNPDIGPNMFLATVDIVYINKTVEPKKPPPSCK